MEKEYKGAMIRSRTESQQRDEEPLKIFKTKERQRGMKNRIEAIESGDSILKSQNDIETAFTQAYKGLFDYGSYTCDRELLQKYASTLNCIDDKTKQQTDECISESEIEWAIQQLKPRKSPGVDGLSTAFYKKFSPELVPILRDVYDDILKRGLLPPSMRRGLTVLLPKKHSRQVPTVSDFRPISLLTTEYKILAKIIARRLDFALGAVIGNHQSYGIKGRRISDNLHAMRILCEATSVGGSRAAVLQVDLSKAFDRVTHDFLFNLLKACNIGDRLLKYIGVCYRQVTTRLVINGRTTPTIQLNRSVRQGCPMSPVLFALYLEPLCRTILNDSNITGFSFADTSLKVLAYADDLTLVGASREEIRQGVQHVLDFCSFWC